MTQLIRFSVKDILSTGDQSLTDVLSCCPTKNIWYQIVPWKKYLADNLAKQLPNAFVKKASTSCGALKGLSIKQDGRKLVKENDFRDKGRRRMDAVVFTVVNSKDDKILGLIEKAFLSFSDKKSLIKKLSEI